jgi:hypothetical protein
VPFLSSGQQDNPILAESEVVHQNKSHDEFLLLSFLFFDDRPQFSCVFKILFDRVD